MERIERARGGRTNVQIAAVFVAMIVLIVIVLAGCSASPTEARRVPPPPTEQQFTYEIAGSYATADGSETLVLSDVGSPDSVSGVGTMEDGTRFYVVAGRHGGGALNGTWIGTDSRDQSPDFDATIVVDDPQRSTNFTLNISFGGRAVQSIAFVPR